MFSEWKHTSAMAKLLTISAVGMMVSLGLCGAFSALPGMGSGRVYFLIFGAVLFVISLLGLIVGLFWAMFSLFFGDKR